MFVVCSQAILLPWPDAPSAPKITPDIDLHPENNREWEVRTPLFEASEEISALFCEMSAFHQRFVFYPDGVNANTAQMPPDASRMLPFLRCLRTTSPDQAILSRARSRHEVLAKC